MVPPARPSRKKLGRPLSCHTLLCANGTNLALGPDLIVILHAFMVVDAKSFSSVGNKNNIPP